MFCSATMVKIWLFKLSPPRGWLPALPGRGVGSKGGVRMRVPCVFPVGRGSQDHVVLVKQTHLFHVAGAWPRSWDLDVRSLSPAVAARVCWGRCVPGSTRALMAS